MKISHQDYAHVSVLRLSGELTTDDRDAFERAASDRIAAGARHVILDCEHLEFVDSQGLESWLRLQERIGASGGQLRLVKPDDTVSTILHLTRLNLAFEAHPTLEVAIRSLR